MTEPTELTWKQLAFNDALVTHDVLDQSDFVSHNLFAPNLFLNSPEGFFFQIFFRIFFGLPEKIKPFVLWRRNNLTTRKSRAFGVFAKKETQPGEDVHGLVLFVPHIPSRVLYSNGKDFSRKSG